jgi:hypothetical protein
MVQRAIWRKQPDDPKTGIGWLLRDQGSRWLSWPVAFALMVALGAMFLGWNPWSILALPMILLHIKTPPPPSVAGSPLATVPPPGPAFECDIEISRDGLVYGTDQGIVTFVSGWLHFAGRRTEFAIEEGFAQDFMSMGTQITLLLGGEEIEFRPRGGWDAEGKFTEEQAGRFRKAFGVWFHSPSAREGTSTLPPREVHASGLARAWRQMLSGLAIDAAFLALMSALLGQNVFVLFMVGHSFSSISRLRRLSRLAHEQKRALANVSKASIGPS